MGNFFFKWQRVSPSFTPLSSTEHNGHFTDFTHHLEMANGNVVGTETENKTKKIYAQLKAKYNRFSGAKIIVSVAIDDVRKLFIPVVHFLMYDKNASP